ncbi:hypothetical protein GPECTOR_1g693 [Gonium pectorale]|uniref:Phospholipase B-like n=1 Tax=Gonium pectorale TaxID=33097 RepID=A0A150H3P7_GONPE|nr:hypothetical protein GPECTOR_1g693 [Gonium pectorale]|eukprot:KXZ56769.1 hypothetical protein GPECTOR_1g693 [Gonium pectorale]
MAFIALVAISRASAALTEDYANFGKLRIVTKANHSNADQMFAAGYLEGYLTAERIYDHHYNLRTYFVSMLNLSESLEAALDWLEDQEAWAAAHIRTAPPSDPYWRLLGLVQQQFHGLVAGYQQRAREEAARRAERRAAAAARRAAGRRLLGGEGEGVGAGAEEEAGGDDDDVAVGWLERRDLLFLNSNGDVYDIVDALEAGRFNSGTYNNQYMIINANRFKPRDELQPGVLWVLEQMPGMIKSADMTEELSRGYWPSYNVAYFPDVYAAAGYPDMIARLEAAGAEANSFPIKLLRYQIAPRAQIFRRDQGGVEGLESLKRLMRYNDWRHDPVAEGNPVGAVCARGDLAPGEEALAKGCFDSKVTNLHLLSKLESEVVGGPTAQGQPPFSWSDPRWAGLPHRGMPDTHDFDWERMTAAELPTRAECAAAADAMAAVEAAQAVEAAEQRPLRMAAGGSGTAARV